MPCRTTLIVFLSAIPMAGSLLSGCSSNLKVWPFNDSPSASNASRGPANATEYRCNAGKRFYVRSIENANAVWLIYPDREVVLNKAGSSTGTRYANGMATLEISGSEATLTDGPGINYSGCKATVK